MPKPSKASETNQPPLTPAILREMMERMVGGLGPNRLNDEQRAEELCFEAREAPTQERRLRLVQRALDLDPTNVDALLMMFDAANFKGDDERIEVLRGIVAIGEKRLGKKAFQNLVPHFWGVYETRPYMRARECLAGELLAVGRIEDATEEYKEMLTLNESDSQGVRFYLLPCLLALGRLVPAQKLIKRFEDELEWSVVFAWGHVLERLLSGDTATAVEALAVARKQNEYIEVYLKGKRKLPKTLPLAYMSGSLEEALCYAEPLLMAWNSHPEAMAWLLSQSTNAKKSTTVRKSTPGKDSPSKN